VVADPSEGVERADAATEPVFLGLVLVLVAVLGVVAAAVFLGAVGLLELLDEESVGGRVRGGFTLPTVIDAWCVQHAVCIEALA
jgi:uncharacterized membrane protein